MMSKEQTQDIGFLALDLLSFHTIKTFEPIIEWGMFGTKGNGERECVIKASVE